MQSLKSGGNRLPPPIGLWKTLQSYYQMLGRAILGTQYLVVKVLMNRLDAASVIPGEVGRDSGYIRVSR